MLPDRVRMVAVVAGAPVRLFLPCFFFHATLKEFPVVFFFTFEPNAPAEHPAALSFAQSTSPHRRCASSRLLASPAPYAVFAVSFTPSARAILTMVSKRGFAPGASALYKLSRPSPVSLAI